MTSKDFLNLHLSLLLAQHGERAVVECLAKLLGSSADDLLAKVADTRKVGYVRSKAAPGPRNSESVEALLVDHIDKAQAVRELQSRFEAGTFLPEMKDVRRFLDRHGQSSASLKKRDAAFAKVARQLVQIPLADLESMLAIPADSSFSSLGVISDQILGRN